MKISENFSVEEMTVEDHPEWDEDLDEMLHHQWCKSIKKTFCHSRTSNTNEELLVLMRNALTNYEHVQHNVLVEDSVASNESSQSFLYVSFSVVHQKLSFDLFGQFHAKGEENSLSSHQCKCPHLFS